MKKPWWMEKNEPAQDYEEDANGYYGGASSDGEENAENSYESYEDGDVSEVNVALSGDPVKEVAKAEPLMKKSFYPKTCQDSQAIVDAYKEGKVVLICVEELDRDNFLRLFDYVMGAVQALDGELFKLDRDTVVLLPYGINTDVNIDELEEDVSEDEANEDGKDVD